MARRGIVLDVKESSSQVCAAFASARNYAAKGATAFVDWIRKDPYRLSGYLSLAGGAAMLVAGGLNRNPLIAYCGISGLVRAALNSMYGVKIAPLTNALLVVQGMVMTSAGFGAASHSGFVLGEVISGVSGSTAGIALGRESWLHLFSHRPTSAPGAAAAPPIIDVAASTSRTTAVSADVHGLGDRLAEWSHKAARRLHEPAAQANVAFGIGIGGLVKAALTTRSVFLSVCALCFVTSNWVLMFHKKGAPSAEHAAAGAAPLRGPLVLSAPEHESLMSVTR